MGHGHTGLINGNPLMVVIIIFVFIILMAGIMWLVHRSRIASDGLSPVERKDLDYPACEILSMLRQHGGPMMQNEIIDLLPAEPDDVAEVFNDMEKRHLIHREWQSEQGTYKVTVRNV